MNTIINEMMETYNEMMNLYANLMGINEEPSKEERMENSLLDLLRDCCECDKERVQALVDEFVPIDKVVEYKLAYDMQFSDGEKDYILEALAR